MSIIIGADLVPTPSNYQLFSEGNVEALIGQEMKSILLSADYRIFNLELPLTDKATPIAKLGPALIAPTATVAAYKAMNVDLLTLANNHILDQGEQGLKSTLNVLKENKIDSIGAGQTFEEAAKPHIFSFNNKAIGVYACAEHEFSIVTNDSPGANPFDPLESLDHIAELKSQCDYVIVLHHGGKEHFRYPSPNLQRVCRKMVDKGADLVVCQHSHCIGCEEKYKSGTIVYGQGNFVFDYSKNECWKTSLLVEIDEGFNVKYLPIVKEGLGVRLAAESEGADIIEHFKERGEQIKEPGFVFENYKEYALSVYEGYFLFLAGKKTHFFARVANRLTGRKYYNWLIKRIYSKRKVDRLLNYIQCEPHREIIETNLIEFRKNN